MTPPFRRLSGISRVCTNIRQSGWVARGRGFGGWDYWVARKDAKFAKGDLARGGLTTKDTKGTKSGGDVSDHGMTRKITEMGKG